MKTFKLEIIIFFFLFSFLEYRSSEELCSKYSVKNPSQIQTSFDFIRKQAEFSNMISLEDYTFKNAFTNEKIKWKLEIDSTDISLGEGSFGKVFKIECPSKIDSKRQVAVKQIALKNRLDDLPFVVQEIQANLGMNGSGFTPKTYGCVYVVVLRERYQ